MRKEKVPRLADIRFGVRQVAGTMIVVSWFAYVGGVVVPTAITLAWIFYAWIRWQRKRAEADSFSDRKEENI